MKVLITGDSMVKHLSQYLPSNIRDCNIKVKSFPGIRIQGLTEKVKEFEDLYDIVVLHIGTNNCQNPGDVSFGSYKTLLEQVQLKCTGPVLISEVLPRKNNRYSSYMEQQEKEHDLFKINKNAMRLNYLLRMLCFHRRNLRFCKSATSWDKCIAMDGVHLSRKGNQQLAELFRSSLECCFVEAEGKPQMEEAVLDTLDEVPAEVNKQLVLSPLYSDVLKIGIKVSEAPKPNEKSGSVEYLSKIEQASFGRCGTQTCSAFSMAESSEWIVVRSKRPRKKSRLNTDTGTISSTLNGSNALTKRSTVDGIVRSVKKRNSVKVNMLNTDTGTISSTLNGSNALTKRSTVDGIVRSVKKRNSVKVNIDPSELKIAIRGKIESNFVMNGGGEGNVQEQVTYKKVCLVCSKSYSSASSFSNHRKSCHKVKHDTHQFTITNQTNQGNTANFNTLNNMPQEFIHDTSLIGKRKLISDNENYFACNHCFQHFRFNSRLQKHLASCSISVGEQTIFSCPEPQCEAIFSNATQSIKHGIKVHNINTGVHHLTFKNVTDFEVWMDIEGTETLSSFKKDTGTKLYSEECQYSYYSCQFCRSTPNKILKKSSKKNAKGTIPFNVKCPARIVAHNNLGEIQVTYFSSHNHPLSAKHIPFQPIKKTCRQRIKANLQMGIEKSKILENVRPNSNSRNNRSKFPVKEDCLTSKNLKYYVHTFKSLSQSHAEDAVSVDVVVNKLSKETYSHTARRTAPDIRLCCGGCYRNGLFHLILGVGGIND